MLLLYFMFLFLAMMGMAGASNAGKTTGQPTSRPNITRTETITEYVFEAIHLTTTTTITKIITEIIDVTTNASIATPIALIDAGPPDNYSIIKNTENLKFSDFDTFNFPDVTSPDTCPAPVHGAVNLTVYTTTDINTCPTDESDDSVSALALQYNRAHQQNQIPHFVVCASTHSLPHIYTRREIFLAIRTALQAMDSHADSRPTAWPRALGFRRPAVRPDHVGDATGRLFEYPITPLGDTDMPATVVDRVVFDAEGLYAGILRYHDEYRWHYCYPEGWRDFFRRRRPVGGVEGAQRVNAMRNAISRWMNEFGQEYWADEHRSSIRRSRR